jgi:hypothetical protein
MVIKKKRVLGNIKRMDERYELKHLHTCSMQLLKYNLTGNNVEGIYNVYL